MCNKGDWGVLTDISVSFPGLRSLWAVRNMDVSKHSAIIPFLSATLGTVVLGPMIEFEPKRSSLSDGLQFLLTY